MFKTTLFKPAITLLLLIFTTILADAQYLRTSYFMEGTKYRMQLNPASTPSRGYISVPGAGSLNVSVNSSSFGIQDVIDMIDNSGDSKYFLSRDFLDRLDTDNNLNVHFGTDILSAGIYIGKSFWSFDIGLSNDIGAKIPKNIFEYMRNVDGLDLFDLSDLNERFGGQTLEMHSFASVGIGYARTIGERLSIGGKVKAILGINNLKLSINDVHVQSNITGINNGNIDIDNITGKATIDVDATLESSSKFLKLQQNRDYIDDIEFGSFGFSGYGVGIDLGITYKLLDRLTLSASLLDLGFIKWSGGNTQIATARAHEDYDITNYAEFIDIVTNNDLINYDMLKLGLEENAGSSRTSKLSSTVVVGAEYEMLNNWLVLGAIYTGRFIKPIQLNELTLIATVRPKHYFNLALSYSLLQGAGKTFGIAIKLGPLFIGTDYMYLGKNTKNLNGYLGLTIPITKPRD